MPLLERLDERVPIFLAKFEVTQAKFFYVVTENKGEGSRAITKPATQVSKHERERFKRFANMPIKGRKKNTTD